MAFIKDTSSALCVAFYCNSFAQITQETGKKFPEFHLELPADSLTSSFLRATLFVRQEEEQCPNCKALSRNQSSSAEDQKQNAMHVPNKQLRSVYGVFICRTERRRPHNTVRSRPSVLAPAGPYPRKSGVFRGKAGIAVLPDGGMTA